MQCARCTRRRYPSRRRLATVHVADWAMVMDSRRSSSTRELRWTVHAARCRARCTSSSGSS
eukprot:scaffold641_cov373-Pavlova_lutheri.AAC.11